MILSFSPLSFTVFLHVHTSFYSVSHTRTPLPATRIRFSFSLLSSCFVLRSVLQFSLSCIFVRSWLRSFYLLYLFSFSGLRCLPLSRFTHSTFPLSPLSRTRIDFTFLPLTRSSARFVAFVPPPPSLTTFSARLFYLRLFLPPLRAHLHLVVSFGSRMHTSFAHYIFSFFRFVSPRYTHVFVHSRFSHLRTFITSFSFIFFSLLLRFASPAALSRICFAALHVLFHTPHAVLFLRWLRASFSHTRIACSSFGSASPPLVLLPASFHHAKHAFVLVLFLFFVFALSTVACIFAHTFYSAHTCLAFYVSSTPLFSHHFTVFASHLRSHRLFSFSWLISFLFACLCHVLRTRTPCGWFTCCVRLRCYVRALRTFVCILRATSCASLHTFSTRCLPPLRFVYYLTLFTPLRTGYVPVLFTYGSFYVPPPLISPRCLRCS